MKKTSKSYKPILLVALATVAVGIVSLLVYQNREPVKNQDQAGPTIEQLKQDADINAQKKQDFIEGNSSAPTTPPQKDKVTLSAQKESNDIVTIFTKLYGIGSGNCTLEVTNGNQNTTQTAEVIYQPEYSSCAGFSVPISSVGKGTWAVKLVVSAGGTTATNAITYEVK